MSNPHEPDEVSREVVKSLVLVGSTQEQIADILKIDDKTLRKYYREELDNSLTISLGKIAKTAYQLALSGDQKMIEFILKCRGKWSYYKPPEEDKKTTTDTLLEKLIDKL